MIDPRSTYFAPGPDGSPARRRVSAAAVELVVEYGFTQITTEKLIERAGVSAAEFAGHFESAEDACIQTYDDLASEFERRVYGAYRDTLGAWRDRLRAAGYAAYRCFRDFPAEARFGAYELMRASDVAQARREATMEFYTDMIDAGRQELDDPESISRSTAESVMGSIMAAVVKSASSSGFEKVNDPVAHLMFIAVRPYLGLEAAEEELKIPPPPEAEGGGGEQAT